MSADVSINQIDTPPSVALQKITRPEIITRAELRRNRVAELVLQDKTEAEIAEIVGCAREHVARLKVDSRTQQRIAYLLEQQNVTGDEVKMTLASHMRADITDLYDEDGELRLDTIRKRNLGHLIKKLKRTRRMEKRDGEMVAVDEIEVELNGQQSAAAQLSKIMGLEKEPVPPDDATIAAARRDEIKLSMLADPQFAGCDPVEVEKAVERAFERQAARLQG